MLIIILHPFPLGQLHDLDGSTDIADRVQVQSTFLDIINDNLHIFDLIPLSTRTADSHGFVTDTQAQTWRSLNWEDYYGCSI